MSRYWTSERMYPSSISLWESRNEEIRDSILARGGTYQEVQNVLGKAGYPRSYEYYAVYKNYPEKGRITYTDKEFKDYMSQEELEKPQWQIFTEEKALVADYQCQKAQTDFRGRTWTRMVHYGYTYWRWSLETLCLTWTNSESRRQ